MNIGCMYLLEFVFSFFRYIFPREELLDHLVYLFLIFRRNHYFFIVAAPIYVPTNSILRFLFLQILTNMYSQIFFDGFHPDRYEVISQCGLSWFSFFWCLVMLSIISFACWPSVYILCKDVYSGLLNLF